MSVRLKQSDGLVASIGNNRSDVRVEVKPNLAGISLRFWTVQTQDYHCACDKYGHFVRAANIKTDSSG